MYSHIFYLWVYTRSPIIKGKFVMRRKDKEITDATGIKNIIEKATVCRLGMVKEGKPYIVPLSFGFRKNVLYFHSALKGRKIDCIRNNSNVCFEFDLIADFVCNSWFK